MRSKLLWFGVYLALVLAPLAVLLLEAEPPGTGFQWDLAIALGFAGLAMMGVQFVLTARFRRATAPFGIDIIYYFHRYLGGVILLTIVLHPVLLLTDSPDLVSWLNPLEAPWHMTAGVLSIVSLVTLLATSALRRQFHLAYEPWRVAHSLLAIAAVGLALAHMEGVQRYVANPWTHALWRAFALSLIASVVFVRIVRPWQLHRRPYRIVNRVAERGDAWTLTVEPIGHRGFEFQPGQFAWLTIGGSPFRMREHPFSFSSGPAPADGRLQFTIKELGDFTRTVGRVSIGTTAYVDGPYGAFTIDRHQAAGAVFVAGGIGVAPIMSMLRALANRGDRRPLLLFYAYRRRERLTFYEEIETLKTRLALTVVYLLEEPDEEWAGERGRITRELLARHLPPDDVHCQYFVCGPEAMTQAVERQLNALGVPMSRVHSELFQLV